MKKPLEVGYALWYRSALRNAAREKVGETWVARSDRRATLSLEMAEALAEDLTRCGLRWEIRDKQGIVVKCSEIKPVEERKVPNGKVDEL